MVLLVAVALHDLLCRGVIVGDYVQLVEDADAMNAAIYLQLDHALRLGIGEGFPVGRGLDGGGLTLQHRRALVAVLFPHLELFGPCVFQGFLPFKTGAMAARPVEHSGS